MHQPPPNGYRWLAFRRRILRAMAGQPCYHCGHGFTTWNPGSPESPEIQHLVSWRTPGPCLICRMRCDLAWNPANLVLAHGSAARRCPDPGCELNCNWLAHNSPDAPRDDDGRALPFSQEFIARKRVQRRSVVSMAAARKQRAAARQPAARLPGRVW